MTEFASTLYPQTNPTNPILLEFRDYLPGNRASAIPFAQSVREQLSCCSRAWWAAGEATDAQIEHARRVLTRLANLSG